MMGLCAVRAGKGVLRGAVASGLLAVVPAAGAADFTVSGVFRYEDRIFVKDGYTGTAQDLPIRHADVEVVLAQGQGVVLATGSTDADGAYSILVTGQTGQIDLYSRCRSASDNSATYHVTVSANEAGTTIHAITTATEENHNTGQDLDFGTYLIQDGTGTGVAQAFNIFDNGIDCFDYLASASGIGRYPTAGERVRFWWNGTSGPTGSYFTGTYIAITSSGSDTDGWSDTVILHESGHWASYNFGNDDNTGGQHFIGDNVQDPRLSYGEGYATFFCGQVREFRAPRLNPLGNPVDATVSIYADLSFPPALPSPGGLGFAYDFETGLFNTGSPIGQVGTANETNVTSVMWDLVDGTGTPDQSPGVDDEPGDETGTLSWDVIENYMTTIGGTAEWITIEDFYQGWFIRHGAGFMQAAMESAYVGLGKMPFALDAYESDDTPPTATVVAPATYALSGGIAVNEVDLGGEDRVEITNGTGSTVNLAGWRLLATWNGGSTTYTFPGANSTIDPGGHLVVHENGTSANNGPGHLFTVVNWNWANGGPGAVTLENSLMSPVDFVRWGGSSTPVPFGTIFTGSVGSPPAGLNLARDGNGTDTNAASDFTHQTSTLAGPNFPAAVQKHTIYPEADGDLVVLQSAAAGSLFVVRAESPHSAGRLEIDVLDTNGMFLATKEPTAGTTFTEVPFLASGESVTFRVRNDAPYTRFAQADLLVFKRPVSQGLGPPVGLSASAENETDVGDAVHLSWLNGAVYDSVRVYRNAAVIAALAGGAGTYTDFADRGPYTYAVSGVTGVDATAQATAPAFAGVLDCHWDEGLESGVDAFDLDNPWTRTSSLSASGSWSLTDSPSGKYAANLNAAAVQLVPVVLTAYPTLEFDHICITEATYDFGILEISPDFGKSWTQLAVYDEDDHPEWNDHLADPGDWVHETLDLNAFAGKKVIIRFRLATDGFIEEDGWYVDNIQLSTGACETVTGVEETGPRPVPLLIVSGANPFRSQLRMTLNAVPGTEAQVQVFDIQGRLVRSLFSGTVSGTESALAWDGRDGTGQTAAAGFYLVRAATPHRQAVSRVVKLH